MRPVPEPRHKCSPYLPAGGAEAVLVGADAVPAESADLVATRAGEEVDVVDLQRLHAQWALHVVAVLLNLWAAGHNGGRDRGSPLAVRWVVGRRLVGELI